GPPAWLPRRQAASAAEQSGRRNRDGAGLRREEPPRISGGPNPSVATPAALTVTASGEVDLDRAKRAPPPGLAVALRYPSGSHAGPRLLLVRPADPTLGEHIGVRQHCS